MEFLEYIKGYTKEWVTSLTEKSKTQVLRFRKSESDEYIRIRGDVISDRNSISARPSSSSSFCCCHSNHTKIFHGGSWSVRNKTFGNGVILFIYLSVIMIYAGDDTGENRDTGKKALLSLPEEAVQYKKEELPQVRAIWEAAPVFKKMTAKDSHKKKSELTTISSTKFALADESSEYNVQYSLEAVNTFTQPERAFLADEITSSSSAVSVPLIFDHHNYQQNPDSSLFFKKTPTEANLKIQDFPLLSHRIQTAQAERPNDQSSHNILNKISNEDSETETEIIHYEEMIVTALKVGEQSPIMAAAGISVFDGNTIEDMGSDNLFDFLQLAPGLSMISQSDSGTTNIRIRGIGSEFGAASVGFYMDDLAFSMINLNKLPDPPTFDLKSVEILKGLQGTLYGAGSSGGVVLIRTNDPVINEFSGKMDLAVGSTKSGSENYSTKAAINLPLIEDKVALRSVVTYEDNSGWIDDTLDSSADDLNSEEQLNLRLKLLAKPIPELTLNLLGVVHRMEHDLGANVADESGEHPLSFFDFKTVGINVGLERDYDQFGAVVSYEFPGFTARNAFGYLDFYGDRVPPLARAIPTRIDLESYVNEFRLNSANDQQLWVNCPVNDAKVNSEIFSENGSVGRLNFLE